MIGLTDSMVEQIKSNSKYVPCKICKHFEVKTHVEPCNSCSSKSGWQNFVEDKQKSVMVKRPKFKFN